MHYSLYPQGFGLSKILRVCFFRFSNFERGTPRGEAGTRLQANELFVHIRNIIIHQISAKFSVFFRSIAKEKVSALPKRKLRGVTPVNVRTSFAVSRINSQFIKTQNYPTFILKRDRQKNRFMV
jgi:hypothetical protein